MSADSIKGISLSSQGASVLDRVSSQAQNKPLSAIQSEVDGLIGSAVSTASDEKMMASLFAAGVAGRFIRLGAVATSGSSVAPLAVQGISYATALGGESAVFAGMERKLAQMEGHPITQSFQKDWARAAINLGSIKFLGGAARAQNLIVQHLLIDTGMVVGHHAGFTFGMTEKAQGTLAQQMIHAEGMNLGTKGSLALLHGFSPGLSAMERSVDFALKSEERESFSPKRSVSFFPQLAWAAKTGSGGYGSKGNSFTGREGIKTRRDPKSQNSFQIEGTKEPGGLADPGLVRIPGGKFRMGSENFENAKPVREGQVSDFLMGETLVTNAQYRRYVKGRQAEPWILMETDYGETGQTRVVDVGATPEAVLPRYLRGEIQGWEPGEPFIRGGLILLNVANPEGVPAGFYGSKKPRVWVSWYEALAYAALSMKGGRLPTEAEWEYAARGPEGRSGKFTREEADFYEDKTVKVGSYPPNGYGLYDMTGNVWEWTRDWYEDSYKGLSVQNPNGPSHGTYKVLRGGGWFEDTPVPMELRPAYRGRQLPSLQNLFIGFRVASPAPRTQSIWGATSRPNPRQF